MHNPVLGAGLDSELRSSLGKPRAVQAYLLVCSAREVASEPEQAHDVVNQGTPPRTVDDFLSWALPVSPRKEHLRQIPVNRVSSQLFAFSGPHS